MEQSKKSVSADLVYSGQKFQLSVSLLDGDIIQIIVQCPNGVVKRKHQSRFEEIRSQYECLQYLTKSSEQFIDLLQDCVKRGKVSLNSQNEIQFSFEVAIREECLKFQLKDETPNESEVLNIMSVLVQKIQLLEQKIDQQDRIIQLKIKKIPLKFQFKNPNEQDIEISNNNCTVKKIGSGVTWIGVIGDRPINQEGRSFFEIRIDQCDANCYIMVGFTHQKEDHSSGYCAKPSGYMFYGLNGDLVSSNKSVLQLENMRCKAGDRIKALFDAESFKIQFYVNGMKMGAPQKYPIDRSEVKNIYPCVDLYTGNEQITLLNQD